MGVPWGWSFKKGFKALLWSIIWGLIGMGVSLGIILVTALGSIAILSSPWTWQNPQALVSALGIFIIFVFIAIAIGSLVAIIGQYATIIKIAVEGAQELSRRQE